MLPRKLGTPPVSSSTNHKFETMIDFFMNYDASQFIPYLRELNLAFKANKINTQTFVNLLTEPNRAGFTPLIEALYFQNINNNLGLYFSLLRYLFMTGTYQGSMNLQDYFNYLIRPNNAGFTPLLQALKSASLPNLNSYLSELQWIVEEVPQCEQSYFDLFLTPNNSGFTPLLQVLYSKNHKNQQIYFLELERGYARGFIKNEDYLYLLMRSNNKGVTPMHELLRSNNKQILATYFRVINKISRNNRIDIRHYSEILTQPNDAGFTPLHNALTSRETFNMSIYLDALREAVDSEGCNIPSYIAMLIYSNYAGLTPLDAALEAGNVQNLSLYFDLLDHAIQKNWLSIESYRVLLEKPNLHGYTPIWVAARGGCFEVVDFFITKLKKVFLTHEYKKIISYKINDELPCCKLDTPASIAINQLVHSESERLNSAVPNSFSPGFFRNAPLPNNTMPYSKAHFFI